MEAEKLNKPQEQQCNIHDVSNCVKNCTDFKNIESLLFDFWVTIKNDVDCINSENIIGKINNFCKTLK